MGREDQARDEHGRFAETGTSYTKDQLFKAAKTAGKRLYGSDLIYDNKSQIDHANKKELVKHKGTALEFEQTDKDEEYWDKIPAAVALVDDYEYQFNPSTGDGVDASNEFVHSLTPDKDGNIYLYDSENGIRIIHGDNNKPKEAVDHWKTNPPQKIKSTYKPPKGGR